MKNMKRFFAMVLAVMMVLSMATVASAANTTSHTITINNEAEGYTYVAYQVFKGDLVDGQLQNIEWGSNISDANGLMTALKANENFADCENVVDVATKLAENQTADNDVTKAFADIVADYLTETVAGTSKYENKKYTIPVAGDGYYLVENTVVPENASYTRYILKVVADVNVNHKGTVPSVEKKILEKTTDAEGKETTTKVDANTAEIGETVTYEFTGTMPSNIADYDTYYYVFTDTMSDGLTYTNNVKVTVNGKDVTKYFYVNASVNAATDTTPETTTLKVGIKDILALEKLTDPAVGEITADTKVVVTYTAMVDEDANIGVDGETNEVKLDFSNDPNNDGEGATNPPEQNPTEPTPGTPIGETPKDVVKTYTTEIEITKVDNLNNSQTLTGAKFSISGHSSKVMVVNKEMFVEDENGTYYRLKDGTYTTTAPVFTDENPDDDVNPVNSGSYDLEADGTAKKYKKVEVVSTETVTAPFEAEGWVNANGVITFTGLGEGTYTITELVAPEGYNLLTEAITVVISSNADELTIATGAETITWSATVDNEVATINNGVVEFIVKNTSGATLPETGGMGTTMFYIIGGVLVLAAVVLLVTKKRMAAAE